MSDFKTRLSQETGELNEKIKKLSQFIESEEINKISTKYRHLLYIQLSAMTTYLQCLDSRIQMLINDTLKKKVKKE